MPSPSEGMEAAVHSLSSALRISGGSPALRVSPLPLYGGGCLTALLQASWVQLCFLTALLQASWVQLCVER